MTAMQYKEREWGRTRKKRKWSQESFTLLILVLLIHFLYEALTG